MWEVFSVSKLQVASGGGLLGIHFLNTPVQATMGTTVGVTQGVGSCAGIGAWSRRTEAACFDYINIKYFLYCL